MPQKCVRVTLEPKLSETKKRPSSGMTPGPFRQAPGGTLSASSSSRVFEDGQHGVTAKRPVVEMCKVSHSLEDGHRHVTPCTISLEPRLCSPDAWKGARGGLPIPHRAVTIMLSPHSRFEDERARTSCVPIGAPLTPRESNDWSERRTAASRPPSTHSPHPLFLTRSFEAVQLGPVPTEALHRRQVRSRVDGRFQRLPALCWPRTSRWHPHTIVQREVHIGNMLSG